MVRGRQAIRVFKLFSSRGIYSGLIDSSAGRRRYRKM